MQRGYVWTMNDRVFADHVPDRIRAGQRVRLAIVNNTPMSHPTHLHGHSFALAGSGARKDTVDVVPMQTITVDLQAALLLLCRAVLVGATVGSAIG